MKPTFVLYHANCPDGFGAAWAVWTNFEEFGGNEHATYIPVSYGKPLPEIPDGSHVYIVDFSFARDVLIELAARCSVLVIDHHATAQEALAGLDFARFDMKKSGAVLTWEHLYPTREVPEILRYVQDRDLWQWTMPYSKEINAGLWRGTPREFGAWKNLAYLWDKGVVTAKERLQTAGEVIAFSDGLIVDSLCRHPHWMIIQGWMVPAVNTPVLQSEVGHQLLKLCPEAPFAAIYMTLEDGTYAYSLRARTNGFDVSAVAKELGGGGHKAAAGFSHASRFVIVNAKGEPIA